MKKSATLEGWETPETLEEKQRQLKNMQPAQPPIIFLAFANEETQNSKYLRNLRLEHRQLCDIWQIAEDKGLCEIIDRPHTNFEGIKEVFLKYKDRIAVFHFGGHANSKGMLFNTEDKQHTRMGHAPGVCAFLADRKALRLVFLNGCATKEMAEFLSSNSQACVIGTSQSVNDEIALKVAHSFHQSLASQLSIDQAFRDMQHSIYEVHGKQLTRDLVWREEEPPTTHQELWDLYPQRPCPQHFWQLGMAELPNHSPDQIPSDMPLKTYTIEETSGWHTDHCLRPTFSSLLLKELLVGRRSVNLTGSKGQGKKRQLEDLKQLCQTQNIATALLDLKECRRQYDFFLKDTARQLHLPTGKLNSLEELLDLLTARPQQNFLLLIDNLEALNDPKSNDARYNADFVSGLNFIKNMDNCLLLCASQEWLKDVAFENETSLLTLERIEIPALKQTDIQAELERRLEQIRRELE